MPPAKFRTVIEEFNFENQLNNLIKFKVPRVEEFVEGAKWMLARTPHEGKQIGSTDVWFLPNEYRKSSGELPVVLYYTFDDNFVNLLSIVETIYPPKEE
jgi:hypothetical protein